jgi:hypothetical protein
MQAEKQGLAHLAFEACSRVRLAEFHPARAACQLPVGPSAVTAEAGRTKIFVDIGREPSPRAA